MSHATTLVSGHVLFAAGLALLLHLALRLRKNDSAAARHLAWAIALCAIIALPGLTLLPPTPLEKLYPGMSELSPALSVERQETDAGRLQDTLPRPKEQRTQRQKVPAGKPTTRTFSPWLVGFWLSLSMLQLTLLLQALFYVRRVRQSGQFVAPALSSHANDIALAMGVDRAIDVRWSHHIRAPQTVGTLNPVVLLPGHWQHRGDTTVIDHALAHEIAHIKRGDHFWVWLQFLGRIMFPFNPALWYAIAQMNREREAACDDWAMSLGTSPKAYASSLITVAASLLPGQPPELAIPCLRSKTHLRRRIFHMLNQTKSHSTSTNTQLVVLVLLMAFAGASIAAPYWAGIAVAAKSTVSGTVLRDRKNRQPQPGDGLLFAAWEGDSEAATRLLKEGADPDSINRQRDPRTPLLAAARRQHWDLMTLLLNHGADVNFRARGDETVLMAVVGRANPEAQAMAQELLARGAKTHKRLFGDGTPLIAAARAGNTLAVQMLLADGVDPDTWVSGDESAMFHAVIRGHHDIVELLLDAGADPSVRYARDGTPLMLAIRHGHDDIAQTLIEARAPVNDTVRGDGSALIDAARRNSTPTVRALLDAGADVELAVRGDGNALINAARRGHLETTRLLIDHGANVNVHVKDDDTPLINAVWGENLPVIELLLSEGADPNLEGDFDHKLRARRTPLNQAYPDSKIADLLIAAGAQ
ncbi:MAG: ankyrin repeat domain-containing protein [Lysobacterales bacterium]